MKNALGLPRQPTTAGAGVEPTLGLSPVRRESVEYSAQMSPAPDEAQAADPLPSTPGRARVARAARLGVLRAQRVRRAQRQAQQPATQGGEQRPLRGRARATQGPCHGQR